MAKRKGKKGKRRMPKGLREYWARKRGGSARSTSNRRKSRKGHTVAKKRSSGRRRGGRRRGGRRRASPFGGSRRGFAFIPQGAVEVIGGATAGVLAANQFGIWAAADALKRGKETFLVTPLGSVLTKLGVGLVGFALLKRFSRPAAISFLGGAAAEPAAGFIANKIADQQKGSGSAAAAINAAARGRALAGHAYGADMLRGRVYEAGENG